ncbi:hypothetical protein HDU87_002830 [Geranomyces variabilis]|uniref:Adenylate kinase n=1 Tax=Geranomyces variabilis TaxID=109894 RepID=A0AAD5TL30_9FUNG|nr:hypothetical protein HDU87_002830 [Geranomyces variabilis]
MRTGHSPYFQGLRGATSMAAAHTHFATSIPSPSTSQQQQQEQQHPPIVLVLGGPGSGKGTQATQLSEEFALSHLSTGDLLRTHVASGTHIGKQISSLVACGSLVPDECVAAVLMDAIAKVCKRRFRGVLVDGFPRTLAQAVQFERMVGRAPDLVVYFDAPVGVLEQRLRGRGRFDDVPKAIEKRLEQHARESPAVIDFFARKNGRRAAARAGGEVFIKESALGSPEDVYHRARRHFLRDDNVLYVKPLPASSYSQPVAVTAPPVAQHYPRHYRNQPIAKPYHVPALWRSGRSVPKNLALSFINTQGASLLARKLLERVASPKFSS